MVYSILSSISLEYSKKNFSSLHRQFNICEAAALVLGHMVQNVICSIGDADLTFLKLASHGATFTNVLTLR